MVIIIIWAYFYWTYFFKDKELLWLKLYVFKQFSKKKEKKYKKIFWDSITEYDKKMHKFNHQIKLTTFVIVWLFVSVYLVQHQNVEKLFTNQEQWLSVSSISKDFVYTETLEDWTTQENYHNVIYFNNNNTFYWINWDLLFENWIIKSNKLTVEEKEFENLEEITEETNEEQEIEEGTDINVLTNEEENVELETDEEWNEIAIVKWNNVETYEEEIQKTYEEVIFDEEIVVIKDFETFKRYNSYNANFLFDVNKIRKLLREWTLKFYFTPFEEIKGYPWETFYFQPLKRISEITFWQPINEFFYDKATTKSTDIWTIFTVIIDLVFIYFLFTIFSSFWSSFNIKLDKDSIQTNEDLWELVDMWWNEWLKKTIDEIVKLNKVWNKIDSIKWILLYWPPGTWKTLFWKHIAKKLQIPFKYVSAWSFANKYYWWTKDIIQNLFKDIREELKRNKQWNMILFIDELDSIWKKRNSEYWTLNQDWLNQMLTEIDWFNSEDWIIIIWATNMLDQLDEALLSRFNLKIYVWLPNKDERKEIIKNQLKYVYEKVTNNWEIILKTK